MKRTLSQLLEDMHKRLDEMRDERLGGVATRRVHSMAAQRIINELTEYCVTADLDVEFPSIGDYCDD